MTTTAATIEGIANKLGLTMTTVFVPWSQSRNAGEKQPSLNWKVTLHKNGKAFLTTDYMAGCAHCPAYKRPISELGHQHSVMRMDIVRRECETGRDGTGTSRFTGRAFMGKNINPALADVLHCLVTDADAIDFADFESWASEFGYEEDSRSAEAIYKACVEYGLKMRAALGDAGVAKLRDAVRDY